MCGGKGGGVGNCKLVFFESIVRTALMSVCKLEKKKRKKVDDLYKHNNKNNDKMCSFSVLISGSVRLAYWLWQKLKCWSLLGWYEIYAKPVTGCIVSVITSVEFDLFLSDQKSSQVRKQHYWDKIMCFFSSSVFIGINASVQAATNSYHTQEQGKGRDIYLFVLGASPTQHVWQT